MKDILKRDYFFLMFVSCVLCHCKWFCYYLCRLQSENEDTKRMKMKEWKIEKERARNIDRARKERERKKNSMSVVLICKLKTLNYVKYKKYKKQNVFVEKWSGWVFSDNYTKGIL